jgi:hypothetical protein
MSQQRLRVQGYETVYSDELHLVHSSHISDLEVADNW